MPPSSSNIVAEYAKSNRSTCKGCNKSISKKALRLGVSIRDPRGFDSTKWHHLECFSSDFDAVESVKGFDSLQSDDKEALRRLMEDDNRKARGKAKKRSVDDVEHGDVENEPKNQNLYVTSEEADVKITLSIADINDKYKSDDQEALRKLMEDDDRKKAKKRSVDDVEHGDVENEPKKQKLSVTSEEADVKIPLSIADIKDKYKDAMLMPKWKAFKTIIFLEKDDGLQDSSKIAAFDFDGCLANTTVNRTGADAWSLMYPCIPDKLQELHNDGYKLVIFTNESNIERWKNKRQVAVDSKIGRLNNFIKRVNLPIQVFIACGFNKKGAAADPFRKPKPGMWHIMEKHFNTGIKIDMDQSFYVGDAAGRPSDHSDADIKFAEAVGLKFYVPEKYFDA